MRIIVQFGDTRFLHDRRLVELPSDNFAAEPIAGFKDRDVTLPRRALLQRNAVIGPPSPPLIMATHDLRRSDTFGFRAVLSASPTRVGGALAKASRPALN